ncbi:MAG: P-II family nitrogen regulator [Candidatus Omnitrophica bacterium]|nr:P-II family nitrogen regulator [Candidatus Omnitrophota bacterium]
MKKIEAFVRPEKIKEVRQALENLGVSGFNITQVDGRGNQGGVVQKFQGREYKVGVLPKTKIEIVVKDDMVDRIVDTIITSARTGEFGDGKIFISPVEEAIRIRTGERGESAL